MKLAPRYSISNFRKTGLALGCALALGSGFTIAETFNTADTNEDGMISRDEYYGHVGDIGVYGAWDANDDDLLDENECDTGYDYDYVTWDTDNDGFLDENEFYEGTFDYYDDNEDGHWDGNEWDDAGDEGWLDV